MTSISQIIFNDGGNKALKDELQYFHQRVSSSDFYESEEPSTKKDSVIVN